MTNVACKTKTNIILLLSASKHMSYIDNDHSNNSNVCRDISSHRLMLPFKIRKTFKKRYNRIVLQMLLHGVCVCVCVCLVSSSCRLLGSDE